MKARVKLAVEDCRDRNRRRFLRLCLGVGAAGIGTMSAPHLARAAVLAANQRQLSFDNLHTGERLTRVYWAEGRYDATALTEIDHILRDHRTDETHPIDPRLLDLLTDLHNKLGSAEPYGIISGYRSPTTNGQLAAASSGVAKKSLHLQGMAIDVRLADIELAQLRDAALAMQAGGVGFYQKSDFVHLDTGRVRSW